MSRMRLNMGTLPQAGAVKDSSRHKRILCPMALCKARVLHLGEQRK